LLVTETNDERINKAISLSSRFLLDVYDWVVLGYNCRINWGCPKGRLVQLYNDCVTANHLDIGVGTGYFMDRCRFPSPQPRLVLMDLNPNSLEKAGKRLSRYRPGKYRRNVLEPFNLDVPPFDSIGMMHLLHCLPGNMETKGVVFKNALEVLKPGGVVFGSTILNRGVKPSLRRTLALKMINWRGYMTNLEDSVDGLKAGLEKYFTESSVWTIGAEALFRARK
jgi:SAM-dependent methyltransferase